MRGYGSGSKRERRPGVWELRASGRSQTVRGSAKQAEVALARLVTAASKRTTVNTAATLGDLIDEWLLATTIETSTRTTYIGVLTHLPPAFRTRKLSTLTIRNFDQLYAELTRQGRSPHQVRKLHTALSAALRDGVRWQWLDHHPAHGARIPPAPVREGAEPDETVLRALLTLAARTDVQTGVWIRLAVSTGARRGELLALRWSKVDLQRRTITISTSLEEDRTVKTTKTRKSRTIPLDDGTVTELRRWKAAQGERALAVGVPLAKDPWVLSNEADSSVPWRPDGATQRFRRLCARAGVVGVRLHDLRHAHASMLLRDGHDVVTVAGRLGNTPRTTLTTYAHVMAGADRAAADSIGRRLG